MKGNKINLHTSEEIFHIKEKHKHETPQTYPMITPNIPSSETRSTGSLMSCPGLIM